MNRRSASLVGVNHAKADSELAYTLAVHEARYTLPVRTETATKFFRLAYILELSNTVPLHLVNSIDTIFSGLWSVLCRIPREQTLPINSEALHLLNSIRGEYPIVNHNKPLWRRTYNQRLCSRAKTAAPSRLPSSPSRAGTILTA